MIGLHGWATRLGYTVGLHGWATRLAVASQSCFNRFRSLCNVLFVCLLHEDVHGRTEASGFCLPFHAVVV